MNFGLPVPYLKINSAGEIEMMSSLAKKHLDGNVQWVKDCFDPESLNKLSVYLQPFEGEKIFEANLKGRNAPFLLADVHISWEEGTGHIVFIPTNNKVHGLEEKLSDLRLRLASTDFELFEKKEALEEAMKRLDELSGPFIPVSDNTAFVPLFGDITESKMNTVTGNALKAAYEGQFEEIFFDLSATGDIEEGGVRKLNELFRMLQYMNGRPVKVIGVKPKHARTLNELEVDWPVYYETSLKEVLFEIRNI